MCFFASAADAAARSALEAISAHLDLFDDERITCFGVSLDPADDAQGRVVDQPPGFRVIFDFDGSVSRAYGALPIEGQSTGAQMAVRRFWLVLDPALRVMAGFPLVSDGPSQAALFDFLRALPPIAEFSGIPLSPPALFVPDVFEPTFCTALIGLYDTQGNDESGVLRDIDGKSTVKLDPSFKRRRDHTIVDQNVLAGVQTRIQRRLLPAIQKAFHFKATRVERNLVSCYLAEDGGHFRPHRDDTTKAGAHRRFAVSLNLNSDFDGGELVFPEYGPKGYKMPPGMACVFSCSLLHMVRRVTSGRRYAFLPFLYDDAAAKIRLANNAMLSEDIQAYQDPGHLGA